MSSLCSLFHKIDCGTQKLQPKFLIYSEILRCIKTVGSKISLRNPLEIILRNPLVGKKEVYETPLLGKKKFTKPPCWGSLPYIFWCGHYKFRNVCNDYMEECDCGAVVHFYTASLYKWVAVEPLCSVHPHSRLISSLNVPTHLLSVHLSMQLVPVAPLGHVVVLMGTKVRRGSGWQSEQVSLTSHRFLLSEWQRWDHLNKHSPTWRSSMVRTRINPSQGCIWKAMDKLHLA